MPDGYAKLLSKSLASQQALKDFIHNTHWRIVMTPTKYDIIKELLANLPIATFNVQDWCIEVLRVDYRAISVPFEIYWKVVSHPSCRSVYEEQFILYPFLNSFVLCGLEIKCGDDWEFWKLVKETT